MTTLLAAKPRTRRPRTYTVDDVLAMTGDRIYELIDGELKEKDVANKAAEVAFEVAVALREYRQTAGGVVLPPEAFVRLFGSQSFLRRPDTGFVVAGRLAGDELGDGALDIAPDLVVEVISPRDSAEKVEKKLQQYLASGVRLIWAIYPQARAVRVIRADGTGARLEAGQALSGEDVLPGFTLSVAAVLGTPA